MKNDPQNNQNGKQDSSLKQGVANNEQKQEQKKDDWIHKSTGKTDQAQKINEPVAGNEKSNIGVDYEGRIGRAHDQWGNDISEENKAIENDSQVKNDIPVSEPEIDGPIYDPEKTEKKLPRMDEK